MPCTGTERIQKPHASVLSHLGVVLQCHKHGGKAFPNEGIFIHEYNTKRKNNCLHKPRGSLKLLGKHLNTLLNADTTTLSLPSRRAFWAKAFEDLKAIEDVEAGKKHLAQSYS